ncbi:AzlD domain-containing protein [Brevibacillus sp. SAFN-007a]|uniref:AzlD domain-containing protein n=1 Tax=Brevibacillus sp. SAFN-007a TaxID=3436862 RepID=UPI003F7ECFA8
MNLFWLFFLMSIATYFSRRAFMRLPSHWMSARLKSGLSYIPVGIFAALIFPALFVQNQSVVFQPILLAAGVACFIIMLLTKNAFLSFGVSMAIVVIASLPLLP